ncbi:MAG: hypothetical protein COA43_08270 [Robiginitomaculum sp.]|nr:MAG: hypothetical protein COA43_08270 [Robiginitomaculum sp.]
MTNTIATIPIHLLLISLLPVMVVLFIQFKWALHYKEGVYAISRMLGQLLIVGYFLGFIFNTQNLWIVLGILTLMVLAASWISLRTISTKRKQLFPAACLSLFLGGGLVLALITQVILQISPWYQPQFMIPLAGMIFASSMNAISLAADRYFEETGRDAPVIEARAIAFRTALIPITNSMFAVGLVSFPGMMTGQVLSGVDPLIAARYQILVMAMLFGAAGLSSALFHWLLTRRGT